jgi:hypothetical protein
MRMRSFVLALGLLAAAAAPLTAQAWDAPSFFSPRPGEDIGLYLIDADGVDDIGIAGIRGIQSPLLLSWIVGVGGTFNGATWLRVPAGLSIGVDVDAGSLRILPYVHPRIAFDYVSFNDDSDSELNFDLDLGADIGLGPQFVLRFGATVGEWDAIGVGVAYRLGRRVVVR